MILIIGNMLQYLSLWGTGMIASSNTFCPHPGRVIMDLFRQLHAVWACLGVDPPRHAENPLSSFHLIN